MSNFLESLGEYWEYLTKGPLHQVVLMCSEEDYGFAIDFRRGLLEQNPDVSVKLMMGEELKLDTGNAIKLEPGVMTISFIHEGNMFVQPNMETHTMTFEKEDT